MGTRFDETSHSSLVCERWGSEENPVGSIKCEATTADGRYGACWSSNPAIVEVLTALPTNTHVQLRCDLLEDGAWIRSYSIKNGSPYVP